jgi:hypothetical protein
LYPDKDRELTEVDTFEKLKEALKGFEYEKMVNQVTDVPSREQRSDFQSQGKSLCKQ